mgnify:CR=1 FL=1
MSMRKPEQALWDKIREAMGSGWRADRVENKILQGMPDVYFGISPQLVGWLELKVIPLMPEKDSTKLRIPHYTAFQANWHWTHRDFGTKSWILVQGGNELFVFASRMALALFEGMSTSQFRKSSVVVEMTKIDRLKIVDALLRAR